jgi:hypothetical protein
MCHRQESLFFPLKIYANLMPQLAIHEWKIGTGIFITKPNNYYSFTAFSTQISQAGRTLTCHFVQDASVQPFSAGCMSAT